MRHHPHAPDIQDGGIGQDAPVQEHALPSQRDVAVVIQNNQRLRLQARSKRSRRRQDDLAAYRDPSRHIGGRHLAGPGAQRSNPVILACSEQKLVNCHRNFTDKSGPSRTSSSGIDGRNLAKRGGHAHGKEKRQDTTLGQPFQRSFFRFYPFHLTSCRRGRGSHRSPARSQSQSKWPPTSPSGRCIARPRPAGRIASGAPAHGPAGQDAVPHPWFLRTMRSR